MRRSRITITVKHELLQDIDRLVDGDQIRNRSHAIEFILHQFFLPAIKKAVIIAGGRGTNKSLLPINGKPLLEYLINNLKNSQVKDIIICTDTSGNKIRQYFGNGDKFGVNIKYSQEATPLLTGGSLLKIKPLLADEPFLVVHGDILTNLPFMDLVNFHQEYKALATIALTTVIRPEDFGQLQLHGITLVNFYQKNKNQLKSNLINCGIYIFQPEIFDYFPKNEKSFLLENVIENLIKIKKVNGFVFEEQWFDVGNPQDYEKAKKEFTMPPYLNQKSSRSTEPRKRKELVK